ncbi:MAG: PSD1 domain-containing protein [Candidatus Hydrogenedentes bacterium]|nr:PSD1 domain-containing protein [Candidatus Hydrogenedentota bacterium]
MLPIASVILAIVSASATPAEPVEYFEKNVRPILAQQCYVCHGPENQKSGLRLDHIDSILKGGETGPVIVRNDPAASRLIHAIRYADPDLQMPPNGKLDEESIAVLENWIAEGAYWPEEPAPETHAQKPGFDLEARRRAHWAWQSIREETPPAVSSAWPRDDIDRFIYAKLSENNLTPAPPADPFTLLRRLHYVITGLPPDPQTIRDFASDPSDAAYEALVDRLLASPQFGEAWARHWLDLTRYAETYGFELDFPVAEAWQYRDYVIRAFNADLPYDQFVREQIAGDLLEPRIDSETGLNQPIIATGFWNMMQAQHAPVDVRLDHADRVDNQIDVLSKTFLGMTVSCARCHDHKFDAVSTADYYALSGVFRSVRRQMAPLDAGGAIARSVAALTEARAHACNPLSAWLDTVATATELPSQTGAASIVNTPASSAVLVASFDDSFDGWFPSGQAFGENPTGTADWRLSSDKQPVLLGKGQVHSGRIAAQLRGALRSPTFTLDHTRVQVLAAGRSAQVRLVIEDYFIREFHNLLFESTVITVDHGDDLRWLEIAGGLEKYQGCRAHIEIVDEGEGYIAVDEVRFSNDSLVQMPCEAATIPVGALKKWRDGTATRADIALLNALVVQNINGLPQAMSDALTSCASVVSAIPNPVMVQALAEANPVDERIYIRGNHKTLGPETPRRFLTAIDPTGKPFGSDGSGRRELAEQVVSDGNPLTARVMVNRVWQHVFGRGIVATTDNFGVLGAAPTHPELLDHLARYYRQKGWSTKSLIRKLVLSSTFRMSSLAAKPEDDTRDPDNKLLHRMPLRRLTAESVRDSLLVTADNLDTTMYGKSVPAYISPFMGGNRAPKVSGPMDGARRRSIYLEIRRNHLPQLFMAFDFPAPDSTHGTRNVSNVPAQALVLMNDPFVIEQAKILGSKIASSTDSIDTRIDELFLRLLGREASADDVARAKDFLVKQSKVYKGAPGTEFSNPHSWSDLCHALFMAKDFIYVG